MGKKATKAADNVFCIARYEASEKDDVYSSRESAAEAIGIDRTRLARIELGNIVPYPEEVLMLADAYHSPELCNQYCSHECPIGKKTVKELDIQEFDRVALRVLGSLKNIDSLRARLIAIAEDGVVTEDEYEEFNSVLDSLDKISENAQSLKLWAEKYIVGLEHHKPSK
ncbi:MAG: helix-turn-helix domain-containing protein [Lachnospiraceae bacterium]|nr:helix-turn-helix domain-containing protein [Lachnospiraceae bacterium]